MQILHAVKTKKNSICSVLLHRTTYKERFLINFIRVFKLLHCVFCYFVFVINITVLVSSNSIPQTAIQTSQLRTLSKILLIYKIDSWNGANRRNACFYVNHFLIPIGIIVSNKELNLQNSSLSNNFLKFSYRELIGKNLCELWFQRNV